MNNTGITAGLASAFSSEVLLAAHRRRQEQEQQKERLGSEAHAEKKEDGLVAEASWASGIPRSLRVFHYGAPKHQGRLFPLVVEAGEMATGSAEVVASEVLSRLSQEGIDLGRWSPEVMEPGHQQGWARLDAMPPGTPMRFPQNGILNVMLVLRPITGDGGGGGSSDRREDAYFAIGIFGCKTEQNHGTLWRSAYQNGAAYTFTIGARYKRTVTDTEEPWRCMPAHHYPDRDSFMRCGLPHGAQLVAVEMGGTPLAEFEHPARAVYVLGAEDSGVPGLLLKACHHHVTLPAVRKSSFNVAVAGSVLLYDRLIKGSYDVVRSQPSRLPGGLAHASSPVVATPRVGAEAHPGEGKASGSVGGGDDMSAAAEAAAVVGRRDGAGKSSTAAMAAAAAATGGHGTMELRYFRTRKVGDPGLDPPPTATRGAADLPSPTRPLFTDAGAFLQGTRIVAHDGGGASGSSVVDDCLRQWAHRAEAGVQGSHFSPSGATLPVGPFVAVSCEQTHRSRVIYYLQHEARLSCKVKFLLPNWIVLESEEVGGRRGGSSAGEPGTEPGTEPGAGGDGGDRGSAWASTAWAHDLLARLATDIHLRAVLGNAVSGAMLLSAWAPGWSQLLGDPSLLGHGAATPPGAYSSEKHGVEKVETQPPSMILKLRSSPGSLRQALIKELPEAVSICATGHTHEMHVLQLIAREHLPKSIKKAAAADSGAPVGSSSDAAAARCVAATAAPSFLFGLCPAHLTFMRPARTSPQPSCSAPSSASVGGGGSGGRGRRGGRGGGGEAEQPAIAMAPLSKAYFKAREAVLRENVPGSPRDTDTSPTLVLGGDPGCIEYLASRRPRPPPPPGEDWDPKDPKVTPGISPPPGGATQVGVEHADGSVAGQRAAASSGRTVVVVSPALDPRLAPRTECVAHVVASRLEHLVTAGDEEGVLRAAVRAALAGGGGSSCGSDSSRGAGARTVFCDPNCEIQPAVRLLCGLASGGASQSLLARGAVLAVSFSLREGRGKASAQLQVAAQQLQEAGFAGVRVRWLLAQAKHERLLTCVYIGGS